jgi:hypothetical protein
VISKHFFSFIANSPLNLFTQSWFSGMKNREILFANFSSGISDSIASAIAPFMDANRADIKLGINLHTRKCNQAVLWLDGEKFHFGYAHKAPDGYVCLFGEANRKKPQDGKIQLLLKVQQRHSLTAYELLNRFVSCPHFKTMKRAKSNKRTASEFRKRNPSEEVGKT